MIKPIKNEDDYNNILRRIDELIDCTPGTSEYDELEIISILAEAWEQDNHFIPDPDPVEVLKNLMEWKGLSRKDMEPFIGSKARVSEILNGKRRLTLAMIMRLKKGLGISADVLIPEWDGLDLRSGIKYE